MKVDESKRVEELVAEIAPELRKLSLDIFNNPELGNEEVKACQWQKELLTKHGFAVTTGFCDIPTAYKAVYKGKGGDEGKQGPKIALLAEYDALPELGHGCGHNLIATLSCGAGIVMREFADKYGGEIHVLGTPAEETVGAKVAMARAGAFDGYDVAMQAHPEEEDTNSMDTYAIKDLKIEFFGKPAHAAGAPEKGINALDAMINFYNLVNALRQQTRPDARIHGVITDGGTAANVIPEYTAASFNVRGLKMAYVEELTAKIKACAEGAATGTGCRLVFTETGEDFKDLCSNHYLDEMVCCNMEKMGHKIHRYTEAGAFSTDVGDVSYQCPAIMVNYWMGESVTGEAYVCHTHEFAEQAASDNAFEKTLDYIKGFTYTAIQLMTEPEHLKAIKEEFNKAMK